MSQIDLISLFATSASLVLAVVAIWLSVVFYKMSSQLSEGTKEAAKGIGASVDRLEKLFDKLYSDTFSMMRDTVSDMRKHIWPEGDAGVERVPEEIEKKADEKVAGLRRIMEQELSSMLERQKITDDKVSSLHAELRSLLDRAISNSRQAEVEAREETVRAHLLSVLRQLDRKSPAIRLGELLPEMPFSTASVMTALEKLRAEGLIVMDEGNYTYNSRIRLVKI